MLSDCSGSENGNCEIFDLTKTVGECVSTNNYILTIDFEVNNPGNEFFEVFVRNNELVGYYSLTGLPLTIADFELSGLDYDFIQICIDDMPDCCIEYEFIPPDC